MTYCVAITVGQGLVFASDSLTNAGVDNISTYRKLHSFVWEGERVLVLLSAGNLATTQAVVRRLETDAAADDPDVASLKNVADLSEAAAYIGRLSCEAQTQHQQGQQVADVNMGASFILGGQIGQAPPVLFLIYPEGNFIAASSEQPFLQIGEFKYGKPILDRVIEQDTSLEDAARCAIVSLDSTMRSNLTVGPPIDLLLYETDSLKVKVETRYQNDDPHLKTLRQQWLQGIKRAFDELPRFDWES